MPKTPTNFLVAFSFAGKERDFIRKIAEVTKDRLGEGKVFFDEWYEHEVAGFRADDFLQELYRKRSRLVVPCISEAYGDKSWTQIEFEAIKALKFELKSRNRILPLRVGDGDIPGIYENAICPDIRNRPVEGIVALILARLQMIHPELVILSPETKSPETIDIQVVPKGLRSFDHEDKDFFLDLLPGTRRGNFPESVRFWKSRIETIDPDQTFKVGLIIGPSGCGKSSFVKAGLLPRLSEAVIPVYLEATAEETETRMLRGLRKHIPEIPPECNLIETFETLQKGYGPKVVVIVDQFEQWLHEHRSENEPDLIRACRFCDGENLQVILMVRDDFCIAIHRFLKVLDITIDENRNFAVVDLFTTEHAESVLEKFGRAYGRFETEGSGPGKEHREFLSQAAGKLAERGRVVAVRLALFADMIQTKPWTGQSLNKKGALEEIGVQFLDESFKVSSNPAHRSHAAAAAKVLAALLPELGADIKGHMKSHEELLGVSGYEKSSADEFNNLLNILNSSTRLITPTDPEGIEQDNDPHRPQKGQGRYYQLTHDYLVPSIREWLTRKQRETRRGRAEIILDARAGMWNKKPESRYLPGLLEWLRIELFSLHNTWNVRQRFMMTAARRYYGFWNVGIALILFAVTYISWETYGKVESRGFVASLSKAKEDSVPEIMGQLPRFQRWVLPQLEEICSGKRPADARGLLHSRLALLALGKDEAQVPFLVENLLTATPQQVGLIRDGLEPYAGGILGEFWKTLRDPEAGKPRRFRAGLALGGFASTGPDWREEDFRFIAEHLININPEHQALYREYLRPIGNRLIVSLEEFFLDRTMGESQQLSTANALVDFAGDNGGRIANLLTQATRIQYPVLFSAYTEAPREKGRKVLQDVIDTTPEEGVSTEDRISLGQRRASAAITRLRQGAREELFPTFEIDTDPEAMTQFVHRCREWRVQASELLESIEIADRYRQGKRDKDRKQANQVLYALLLAMGEYPLEALPAGGQSRFVDQLVEWYGQDMSSAIHSATGWLLRRWEQDEKVQEVEQIPIAYSPGREWFTLEIPLSEDLTSYFTFVVFDPGVYEIGSPTGESDRDDNESRHSVELSRPFAILDREVTMQELIAFNSSDFRFYMEKVKCAPEDAGSAVDWYDAVRFCRWLTRMAGWAEEDQPHPDAQSLDPGLYPPDPVGSARGAPKNWPVDLAKPGFRLPTEAEWEIAARAGMVSSFSFGNDRSLLSNYAWFLENSKRPVDPKKKVQQPRLLRPNPRGLFDMHGNVWEWCYDWSDDYKVGEVVENPKGPNKGTNRVMRGGGWDFDAAFCRSADRSRGQPSYRTITTGFRLAQVPSLKDFSKRSGAGSEGPEGVKAEPRPEMP